jgi:small subunit ribosomal protein S8
MALVDPIADMLTRIRNGHKALFKSVEMPKSQAKMAMAAILKAEGYIAEYEESEKTLRIVLKYKDGKPLITGLKRISKPGRRVYVGVEEIPSVQGGLGISILSTSKGILEGNMASQEGIGGELLCEVW